MEKSLFSFLKSYIPTEARDPREDYLTQILAWMLIEVEGLLEAYCDYLISLINEPSFERHGSEKIKVQTQVFLQEGRIDLLIKLDKNGLICEHKISSPLRENQIEKYKNGSCSLNLEKVHTVLITYSKLQHNHDADVLLTWEEVDQFLKRFIKEYQGKDVFVIEQLIKYFKEQGLANSKAIEVIEEEIRKLPKGYISKKNINNRSYYYLQKREGSKIVSQFIPNEQLTEIKELIIKRKQFEESLRDLKNIVRNNY